MSQLTDNLSAIASIKSDIKSAIEAKGVSMSGVSFPDYASKIGEIQTGGTFVTETLSVSNNGTYTPSQGVDGFSQVVVSVPNSVSGYTFKNILERDYYTTEIVDSGVLRAESYVMMNYPQLTYLNLPNCSYIGFSAFHGCIGLSQVNLPGCVYVESSAFYECTSLTQVNLPVCSYIGSSVFRLCTSLESLILCTDVYWTVEYRVGMLTSTKIHLNTGGSIYVRSETYNTWITSTGWSSYSDRFVSVSMPSPVLSYDTGSVYGLTKAIFSNYSGYLNINKTSVLNLSLPVCTYIGSSTFSGCTSLTELSLPACTYIGSVAFSGCTSLTELSLPVCTYIGSSAFWGCVNISYVYLPVCSYIGNLAFYRWNASVTMSITLGYSSVVVAGGAQIVQLPVSIYVPASLVEDYKIAPNWSYYSSQIFPIPE